MHRRRAGKWLFGLLCIGIVYGSIRLCWPHERRLLSRSALVAKVNGVEEYDWQSPHSILLFRIDPKIIHLWSLTKIDLPTGQHLSYPAIAKHFGLEYTSPNHFETSPDGKWLLWSVEVDDSNGMDTGNDIGWLANLETGHLDHFPIRSFTLMNFTGPDPLYWMSDSEHFVEIDFNYKPISAFSTKRPMGRPSIIRNVNTPQQARMLKLRSDWDLGWGAGIRVLSEEHLVATTSTYYADYQDPPDLVQTSLKSNVSPTQRWPLPLPSGTHFVPDISFSPQGDRYAIVVEGDLHPVWLDMLRRWHIPVHVPPHPQVGIWIFSLDGKQSQEVGHITPERESQNSICPYYVPQHLRWSPDGKQLGFVYKGDLYRVPTD
jgi:hypothetical protein